MRRLIALLTLVVMVSAYSSTRQLPRDEFGASSRKPYVMYVVATNDGEVCRVSDCEVTDSTFVIRSLRSNDAHVDFDPQNPYNAGVRPIQPGGPIIRSFQTPIRRLNHNETVI
jgi:hypothetical protein